MNECSGYKQDVSVNTEHFCAACNSPVPLRLQFPVPVPGRLVQMQILEWDLRFRICSQLPGDVEAAAAR